MTISDNIPPRVKPDPLEGRIQRAAALIDAHMFGGGGWTPATIARAVIEADDSQLAAENRILRDRIRRARTVIEALSRRILERRQSPAPPPPAYTQVLQPRPGVIVTANTGTPR